MSDVWRLLSHDDATTAEAQSACHQVVEGLRIEPMFEAMDALEEGGFRLSSTDGQRFLQDDRSGIHAGVHNMDGDACHLGASAKRIAHRMRAGKCGQERGMDVEDASAIGAHKRGRENPHEAREGNVPDTVGRECVTDGAFKCRAGGRFGTRDDDGGDAVPPRPRQGVGARLIADDERDARAETSTPCRVDEGLEIGPVARAENCEPRSVILGASHRRPLPFSVMRLASGVQRLTVSSVVWRPT